jgi:hypothetical protein
MRIGKSAEGCDRPRREFARLLLAVLLVAPLGACADRLPGGMGDPMGRMKTCIARLRRLGQFSAKLGGRCG